MLQVETVEILVYHKSGTVWGRRGVPAGMQRTGGMRPAPVEEESLEQQMNDEGVRQMNFEKLEQYLDTLPEIGVPSGDLVIYHGHRQVFRHMTGYRDTARTQPLRGDETYNLYSCTKVFTTCAVMQLAEQGRLCLDDPVSMYLPSFADLCVQSQAGPVPAKRTMTLRHLLSMQSGLDYELHTPAIEKLIAETGGHATTREIADTLSSQPLNFEPGTDWLYSLSHDVLGAVIEVITGESFGEYLQAHIFDPLQLETIGFSLKERDAGRQCAQYEFLPEEGTFSPIGKDDLEYRLSDRHESGGAGLIGDVKDYIIFADALACGGTGMNGKRILSPETIHAWRANHLIGRSRASFDTWNRFGYSYALGVRTRVDLTRGGSGAIGEFGWDGAAGAWVMMDLNLHLSAFYAMHVKKYDYCYDVIHPQIRSLIYDGFRDNG